jgi:hypothetical protein
LDLAVACSHQHEKRFSQGEHRFYLVLQRRKGPCDVAVDADRLGSDAFSLWDCAVIMMNGVFDSCPGADRARNRIRSSAPWLRSKVEILQNGHLRENAIQL